MGPQQLTRIWLPYSQYSFRSVPPAADATACGRGGDDAGARAEGTVTDRSGRVWECGWGKDKEEIWDVPKSREVKRLEEIVADLRELQQGDGKVRAEEKVVPDCFCQGALVSAMYQIAC